MQRSVKGLIKLIPHSNEILGYFASNKQPTSGFREQQIDEERLKAELLLADSNWRTIIDRAETHGYFKGQIEFLLDYCGALDRWDSKSSSLNWHRDEHRFFQNEFMKYLVRAEAMFKPIGLNDLGKYRWQRALLSMGNYLLPSGNHNVSFLTNSISEQDGWKRLLRGSRTNTEARQVLKKLFNRIDSTETTEIKAQLEEIICEESASELWRKALIETPEAFDYCEKNAIRMNSESEIYLLKKSQMNGYHAELFTFHLFCKLFYPNTIKINFAPLELNQTYDFVYGTEEEPGFRLTWSKENSIVTFFVVWKNNMFNIFVGKEILSKIPDIQKKLQEIFGFREQDEKFVMETSSNKILDVLHQLAQTLRRITDSNS